MVILAATLMIFGLVAFTKVKLHPPSFITRSAPIHQAMTHLIFVPKVDKLGGNNLENKGAACGCEVATNLYCGYSIME